MAEYIMSVILLCIMLPILAASVLEKELPKETPIGKIRLDVAIVKACPMFKAEKSIKGYDILEFSIEDKSLVIDATLRKEDKKKKGKDKSKESSKEGKQEGPADLVDGKVSFRNDVECNVMAMLDVNKEIVIGCQHKRSSPTVFKCMDQTGVFKKIVLSDFICLKSF